MTAFPFNRDQLELYRDTEYELIQLYRPDYKKDGRSLGKAPMSKSWQVVKPLSYDEADRYMQVGHNIGVRMRPLDLIIDVDPRNGGTDDVLQLLAEDFGLDLDSFPTVITGSGGKHIYCSLPETHRVYNGLGDFYPGIEFKSKGRQVVSAGSVHPEAEQPYEFDPLTPELPEFGYAPVISDKLFEAIKYQAASTENSSGDVSNEELERLLSFIPVQEFDSNEKWEQLMMSCHYVTGGSGVEEFITWSTSDPDYADDTEIILTRWNSCSSDGGSKIKGGYLMKEAEKRGSEAKEVVQSLKERNVYDRRSAVEDFDPIILGDEDEKDLEAIAERVAGDPNNNPLLQMNDKFATVKVDGKMFVTFEEPDFTRPVRANDEDDDLKGEYHFAVKHEFMKIYEFHSMMAGHRIQTEQAGKVKTQELSHLWTAWAKRKTYASVIFEPRTTDKDVRAAGGQVALNLWKGWSVKPKKGDWSLLRELIYEALADDDEAMGDYMLDWAARMFQKPHLLGEVALIIHGDKGTGKTTFFNTLSTLAGRHSAYIAGDHALGSNFNAWMEDCVFVYCDEAFWGGSKNNSSVLKSLITNPRARIEPKGRDSYERNNYVHLGMASNDDWVVPATAGDERRYAVTRCNNKYQGNHAFWKALYSQLNNGGYEAFLHDMLQRDIKKFDPRNIPDTKALAQQKIQTLNPFEQWWFDCLKKGNFGECPYVSEEKNWNGEKGVALILDDLIEAAGTDIRLNSGRNRFVDKDYLRPTIFSNHLRKAVPTELSAKRRYVSSLDTSDGYSGVAVVASASERFTVYDFPPLDKCRKMFDQFIGSKIDWTDSEDE